MKRNRLWMVMVLALALGWAGCGKEDGGAGGSTTGTIPSGATPEVAKVVDDLGLLVPSDAALLVYVPAPADLEKKAQHIAGLFDPKAVEEMAFTYMLKRQLGPMGAYWDVSRPMALAAGLPPEGAPIEAAMGGAVLILPVTDPDKAAATFEGAPPEQAPNVKTSGSYLAMTMGPGDMPNWGDTVPAIAATAPQGDLAVRVDLDALVRHFRTDIDEGLAQMEREMKRGLARSGQAAQLEGMFSSFVGGMRHMVDAAETLDLALSVDGETVDLRVGFTAKAGSELDVESSAGADLAAVAANLPDGFPVYVLAHVDWDKLMAWAKPLMDASTKAMPGEMRGQFEQYMSEAIDMTKLLGPNFAAGLGLTDGGIQGVEVVEAKDAAAYRDRTEKLLASDVLTSIPGFSIAKGESTKVAGVDVTAIEMKMNLAEMMKAQGQGDIPAGPKAKMDAVMQRLFGGPAMKMQVAAVEDKVLFTVGDAKHMEAAIGAVRDGKKDLPGALAAAVDHVGGEPTFLVHADLRAFLQQVFAVAREVADEALPSVPAGGPIPFLLWGQHDGRRYGGGLSLDVGGVAELIKAMDR